MDPLMRLAINLMKLDLAAGLSSGEDLDRDRDERNLNSESNFARSSMVQYQAFKNVLN